MSDMLGKYIMPGNRVDIQKVQRSLADTEEKKTYQSQVLDIVSDERIELAMPFEQAKLVLLAVDEEYDLYFFTEHGLYQCYARVVDRYKNNNTYAVLVDLTSNLRKYQRREYYRFSCALEMGSRTLQEEELKALEQHEDALVPGLPLARSIIVDISGGGLRFVSSYAYEEGSIILCRYQLFADGQNREYSVYGKVLAVKEIENRPGSYEHRVQYVNIDNENREGIIKYIFDEERRILQKTRNP